MKTRTINYDQKPYKIIKTKGKCAWTGYENIIQELKSKIEEHKKTVFVIECYPGVYQKEILENFKKLNPCLTINSDDCAMTPEELEELIKEDLTEDRVFGKMTTHSLSDYFKKDFLKEYKEKIETEKEGIILVYGVGASLITEGDIFIYADMPRWEIQLRYRKGMANWRSFNEDAPILTKYKRGYFAEWRWADKHKKKIIKNIDYLLDTTQEKKPSMVTSEAFFQALKQTAREPFRLVPYFDPGVWGGHWMKDNFGLTENKSNYAWSFDGVPEENSLRYQFGEVFLEIPAIDLVFLEARPLLGEKVHARFGDEFPIRFDLLDTIGGQNLSLQVHPLTEYIQEKFNMHYTQDESYYILDTQGEETFVYLGVQENVNKTAMEEDLYRAQNGEIIFEAEKYINKLPVKKHDHISIPAGTIHCSGAGNMVLEISATPYIFTFKLWDWQRTGLDGKPRPIHLEHGIQNIQWERDTDWIYQNLYHQEKEIYQDEDKKIEQTGLHEREFIETFRHTVWTESTLETKGSVNMLNLVEGQEATILSENNEFPPFTVHYAETFIVPASVNKYKIRPAEGIEKVILIVARVK